MMPILFSLTRQILVHLPRQQLNQSLARISPLPMQFVTITHSIHSTWVYLSRVISLHHSFTTVVYGEAVYTHSTPSTLHTITVLTAAIESVGECRDSYLYHCSEQARRGLALPC